MLARLASNSYRHRRIVVAAWAVALVALTAAAGSFGGSWFRNFALPDTDAARAHQVIDTAFPARSGTSAALVVATDAPTENGDAALARFTDRIRRIDGVVDVDDATTSPDGRVRLVPLTLDEAKEDAAATAISAAVAADTTPGVTVELSGDPFHTGSAGGHESIGILVAIVVLLLAFGSVVAMGLPIVTALLGVGVGLAGVQLWAAIVPTPDFTVQVASMIGIGVGIDYALFIVTRYREALAVNEPHDAVVEAITTAGRAVLFAGSVVVISLLGMLLMGLDFVQGLAIGSSTAVAISVLAALTLLPALLGFTGHTINRFGIGRARRGHRADAETVWHRWSRFLQRHPWSAALAGLATLVLLALPMFSMRLGFSDDRNDPQTQTTRRAYDLIADGFGAGANGPLLVTVEGRRIGDGPTLGRLTTTLAADRDVVLVAPPALNASGDAAIVRVIPKTSPQDARTAQLVHRLRATTLPAAVAGTDAVAHVGGPTAAAIDYSSVVGDRLPTFVAAVLFLSFVLLMAVFRSVLVPLKAVLMNLLSIGAAYGVMVAVFQWGWAKGVIGIGQGGPIEPWAPMMLFAITFGLSMDYEVFLLSRVKEEHDRTGDNGVAVVEGLASTARVITAAAAIMVAVFGSFVLGDLRAVKLIGLGLGVAVFVDATVVRCVLVPATMELLGERNWWFPGWLERIVPRIDVEASGTERSALAPA
jgi:RND superfamily putative drug exporter